MTEPHYPTTLVVDRADGTAAAVIVLALDSILDARLLEGRADGPTATALAAERARAAALAAVTTWGARVGIELTLVSHPDLTHPARGRFELSLALRTYGRDRRTATAEALARFVSLQSLLIAAFPAAELVPVQSEREAAQAIRPFEPASAASIQRRRDRWNLADLASRRGGHLGFGPSVALPRVESGVSAITHVYPWIPNRDPMQSVLDALLWLPEPMWIRVSLRPRDRVDEERDRLDGVVRACEEVLSSEGKGPDTVFGRQARTLCDAAIARRAQIDRAALDVAVSVLSRTAIDEALVTMVARALLEWPSSPDPATLLAGGFVVTPIDPGVALDPDAFPDASPFTPFEAAAVFRVPDPPTGEALGLPLRRHRTAFADLGEGAAVRTPGSIVLARNRHRGITQDLHLSPADRMRHMFVIGQTGTGKSTLLESLMMQDIRAGRGVCVIDPHGDMVERILGKIPPRRVDDVVIVDPADTIAPIGLNLLEWETIEERDFVIDELFAILDRLYDLRLTGGPIFERYFRGFLKLLMGDRRRSGFVPTVLEFPLVFTSAKFRSWLLESVDDPVVHDLVREGGSLTHEHSLQNLAPYITSKLGRFINDRQMQRIVGQEQTTIDFADVLNGRRILLAKLAKGRFGEAVGGLLMGTLVARLRNAAMARTEIRSSERQDFFLYVDEFQNLVSDTFGELLAEARKFRLGLVLANQYAAQLRTDRGESLLPAVLGNVGTVVAFRLGPLDAEHLEPLFRPQFSRLDIGSLPNWRGYASLTQEGSPALACSFETIPDAVPLDTGRAEAVRARSRRRHGTPVSVLDRLLRSRRNRLADLGAA